ncbi:MAG: hypothetical protein V1838_04540 [Patescibacteria group bacterium]
MNEQTNTPPLMTEQPSGPPNKILFSDTKPGTPDGFPAKKRWRLPVIFVSVLIGLAIVTAALGRFGMLPFDIPYISQRNELLAKMIGGFEDIGDMKYQFSTSINSQPRTSTSEPLYFDKLMAFSSSAQDSTIGNQELINSFFPADLKFIMTMAGRAQDASTSQAQSELNIAATYLTDKDDIEVVIDQRSVQGKSYIKIDKLNIGNWLSLYGIDLNDYVGKWINFSADDLGEIGKSFGSEEFAGDTTYQPVELLDQIEEAGTIVEKNKFLFFKEIGNENIDGTALQHWQVTADFTKAAETYKEVGQFLTTKYGKDALVTYEQLTYQNLGSDDFKNLAPALSEAFVVNAWVTPDTNYLRRIQFQLTFVPTADSELYDQVEYVLTMDSSVTPLEQWEDITAPSATIGVEEIMNEIFGAIFENLMGGLDLTDSSGIGSISLVPVDDDNDNLIDSLEAIYGTDPTNPDSDGDGYLDGDEVNNGFNPIGEGELIKPLIPLDL